MSPAVLDFRSPVSSSSPPQSKTTSFQNPNPNPKPHTPLHAHSPFGLGAVSSNDRTVNMNLSTVEEASESSFGVAFTSPVVSRVGLVKPPLSVRSKPRLTKVRKHLGSQNGKSKTVSDEIESGFNPFMSASKSSDRANDGNNTSNVSNGLDAFVGDNKFGKCENVGFVFGANGSDSTVNLDSTKRETSKNVENLDSFKNGTMKLENEEKGEFGNIGFVFSASKSNLGLNGKIGNGEPGGNVGKTGADNSEKVNINIEAEPRKFDNVEFVIVDNQSDSGVNLSSENRDSSNSVEKPCLDERGKDNIQSEAQCGKHGNIDFVFAANQMTSASNSKEKDCRENAAKFCVDDKHKNTIGVEPEVKKYDHVGAVFGSSWSSSATNSNMENLKVRSETEYRKAKTAAVSFDASGGSSSSNGLYGKGVFVFGESSHQSFKFNEGMAAKPSGTDELNKLSSEDFRYCNGIAKSQNGDSGSDPGIAKTEASDLDSGANDSNVSSTYSTIPFYKLPDEMRKLNINDLGKINGPDNVRGSNINPSADSKNLSEFGCLNKASSSSTEGSVTTSQIDNSNSNGLENASTAEKTSDPGFQSNGHDFEESSTERVESRDKFSFTGTPDKSAASSTDFRTPKWDPSSFKENLFPDINRKFDFSPMSRSVKSRRSKKVGRKLRQPRLGKLSTGHDFVQKESTCQENPDSPGSPMDFSPYQETIVANPYSQENSVTSTESFHPENKCATSTAHSTVFQDVTIDPVTVRDGFDISGVNNNCSQTIMDNHGAENAHFKSNADQVCGRSGSGSGSGSGVNLAESGVGFSIDTERQANKSKLQFPYASGFEDMNEKSFSFSASFSAQGSLSATKRRYRKKNRLKVGRDTLVITPRSEVETPPPSFQFSPHANPSSRLDAMPSKKGDKPSSQSKEEADKEQVKKRSISSSAAVREACEKWRARGNEAYKNRDLSKAEDCYTRGIKSVPRRETSGCWIEPLVLCYSNRATTRMSLGKIREALGDCMRATALDPNFPKVQMRAANCHLLLGEVENAVQYFSKCLKSGTDVCLDRRIVIEASDGIQKAQKVAACTKQCAELLQQRTSDAASSALTLIEDAVSISPFSEILLEIKAEALFLLRKFEEVIQLCEHTLNFAEKILPSVGVDDELSSEKAHNGKKNAFVKLWRRRLISKSYFHMGRLESALDLLEKEEQLSSLTDMCKSKGPESPVPLAVTIRELLRRKHAGNEAFQAGRHTEALEHYTAALSTNVESRPFAAVCFCNRAAAHQALGQIADAIADCSLAIALDGNYPKAVSRRATLHEMIRDYAQAANDLQRYISILEKQSHEKSKQSGGSGPSGSVKELRQAHRRLSSMEEQSKNDIPLELYHILGIKSSDTASEIKKAYRKAALRHHPDKAGQFLARSESGDDGRLWKEIVTEVHKDADRLFKMINEAYAVLSDPTKRSKYDLEEDMRETLKESNKSSTFRRQPDVNEYPFERRDSRQYWKGTWKTHGNSYSRW